MVATGTGPFQPPQNRIAPKSANRNIAQYSPMKNIAQRKPEYSVMKPATSSLSASGRSNGARFVPAVAQTI